MRPGLRGRAPVAPVTLVLAVVIVAACGSSPASAGVEGAGTPLATAVTSASTGTFAPTATPELTPDEALAAYGQGATPDPSITYQPDVVFVGGGPSAIHWASGDGLTWAIDRRAPGAADLRVGSVMLATSVASGRVMAIDDQGDSRVVTLAPVDITEIVKDGHLAVSQDVDLGSAVFRTLPADFPADAPDLVLASPSPSASAVSQAPDGTLVVSLPAMRLAAARLPSTVGAPLSAPSDGGDSSRLSWPVKLCPEVGVGAFSVKACLQSDGITVNVDAKPSAKLKVGFVIKLYATKLHAQAGTVIANGQVVDSGGILDGFDRVSVKVYGGVQDGAQDNVKVKFEVPLDTQFQTAPIAGVPTRALIETKFTLETAFSGRNSTMSSSAEYAINGPIGFENNQEMAPKVTVIESILDNLSGIAIGPSGVIFGVRVKFQWGPGLPGFISGPYGAVALVLSLGRGSVIGAPLADCEGATLQVYFAAGAGLQLDPSKLAWLAGKDSIFKSLKAKVEEDIMKIKLVDLKAVRPDSPICNG